ncbi:MAG: ABC transporter permease, partial [Bradymonadaceae bacterium]
MAYESFVGLRYLMAKQRSRVVSIITLISISGVALGVTALIVVLSVMGGFKKDLTDKILGAKAHIIIEAADYQALDDASGLAEEAMGFKGVLGASPFIESEVMVSSPTNLSGVVLRGVDIDRVGQVSDLVREITEGKLEYLRDPALLLEEVRSKRSEELDTLLGKLGQERRELQDRIDAKRGESAPEDDKRDEGFMPPMFGDEEETDEEIGFMPPMFGEDAGEDAGHDDSEMPGFEDRGSSESRAIPGLLIGPELAKSLQVRLGDEVNVVTPRGEIGPMGPIPRSRPFRIVGIFYSGMYEYDANFAYTALEDATDFLDEGGATGIEIKTYDVDASVGIARLMQESMGDGLRVLDWQELNRSLFFALKLEKIAMFVVLTFIILVASFSIVAMLIMIVIEKGREIAILKSMGATDG